MDLEQFLKEQSMTLEIVSNHLIMHNVHDECLKQFRIAEMIAGVIATMQEYGKRHHAKPIKIKSPSEYYKGTRKAGYQNKSIWKHVNKK